MFKHKLTQNHIKFIRMLISISLFILAAGYVYFHWEGLKILLTVQWEYLILLIIVGILRRFADAARFTALYNALGGRVGILESFGLSQVAGALNLVLPAQAGSVARAAYLKRQHQIPYSQVLTILLGSIVFLFLIGSIMMTLANIIVTLQGDTVPLILRLGAILGSTSVILFWVTIPKRLTAKLGRIGNMLRLFSDGWKNLRTNKRCLIETGFYQFLMFILSGAVITIAYQSLGLNLSFLVGISIAIFTTFSNTFSITPGNLGIQEAVVAYLSQISGMLFVEGIAAAALLRVTGWFITFAIAPFAWYLLFLRQNINLSKLS